MAVMYGPDGQPPTFNGAAWVSKDGRYWWNGATWQPLKKRRFQPPIALTLIIVAILGGAWFVLQRLPQPAPPVFGVTNATIDSPTQIEFDYRPAKACNDLTFNYAFFDTGGHQVNTLSDEKHNPVQSGKSYHFTIYAFGVTIDSHAVRFTATPICHD